MLRGNATRRALQERQHPAATSSARASATLLIAGLLVTAVAVLALLFVPAHNESPLLDEHGGPRAGCIEVAVAGRVGAEPIAAAARRRSQDCSRAAAYDVPRSETIVADCTEAGVRF